MNATIHALQMIFAAYAFSLAFQMIRGNYLNFKPFNCRFCMSFWFAFIVNFIINHSIQNSVEISFLSALAIAGVCNFLKLIEEKLEGGLIPPNDLA